MASSNSDLQNELKRIFWAFQFLLACEDKTRQLHKILKMYSLKSFMEFTVVTRRQMIHYKHKNRVNDKIHNMGQSGKSWDKRMGPMDRVHKMWSCQFREVTMKPGVRTDFSWTFKLERIMRFRWVKGRNAADSKQKGHCGPEQSGWQVTTRWMNSAGQVGILVNLKSFGFIEWHYIVQSAMEWFCLFWKCLM